MRINSIQTTQNRKLYKQQTFNTKRLTKASNNIQFRGNGKGVVIGLGSGVITSLVSIGGAAITGMLAMPAIVGSALVLASGVVGAILGNKVEDKLEEHKSQNK